MSTVSTLKDRYVEVKGRIADAAKRSGRSANSVLLVAVTKYAGTDEIRELINLGHADFGENKVQQLQQRTAIIDEWLLRQKSMPGLHRPRTDADTILGSTSSTPVQARWHMIGHLQRNKTKKAVELCRLIHSVDTLRLAEEIQIIGLKRDKPVEVLLQVNCSGEEQKYGCAPPAALHLAEQMETMVHVHLRGLMTMAPHTDDPEKSRGCFGRCRELFEEIRESGCVPPRFNILSMGMSTDYTVAIEEGSNLVRVGTALFGEPKPGMLDGGADGDEDDED